LWRAAIAAFFIMVAVLAAPAGSRAGPALVFDTRTGEVLHAYGAFTPWHPASLTKLMTVYVTFQAIREGRVNLDTPVRISSLAASQPPSKMGFPVGTEISLDSALRILMVKSANDIAVAVAETVGGSYDGFIAQMNSAARSIGMVDTVYVNPHGLHDPRQTTTARDLAFLTRALIRDFPQHQHYFEIPSIQVSGQTMTNHNKLIGEFRGADGMKTGYVCASGFNIVATATRGGRRLAAIVLGGLTSTKRNEVTAGLLEAGFEMGGGFSIIPSGRPTIDSLRRPAVIGPTVDMRSYVCQRNKPPAEIVSFGLESGVLASGDQSRSVGSSGSALALAAAPVIDFGQIAAQPLASFDIPLPRPRPSDGQMPVAAAPAAPVSPASATGWAGSDPYPRPNPLR
jgi:D-alanyl-D-alanine carboxypeptidase